MKKIPSPSPINICTSSRLRKEIYCHMIMQFFFCSVVSKPPGYYFTRGGLLKHLLLDIVVILKFITTLDLSTIALRYTLDVTTTWTAFSGFLLSTFHETILFIFSPLRRMVHMLLLRPQPTEWLYEICRLLISSI